MRNWKRFSGASEDALAYVSIGSSKVKGWLDPVSWLPWQPCKTAVMEYIFEGYTIR